MSKLEEVLNENKKKRGLLFAFTQLPIFDFREIFQATKKVRITDFNILGAFLARAFNPELSVPKQEFFMSAKCARRLTIRKKNPRSRRRKGGPK